MQTGMQNLENAADHYEDFIICNPITGEYVFLQRVDGAIDVKRKVLKFGFGYLHSSNEYKVVRIDCNLKTIYAYTLGSGVGWRIIKDKRPYLLQSSSIFCNGGIFANGAIHWLESIKAWENQNVAFDLEDEKFKSVPSPPWEYYHALTNLALLGGNLCVVSRCTCDYERRLDIWAFKKAVINDTRALHPTVVVQEYYNNMWSWNKEFSIPTVYTRWYIPFAITESNELLLLITEYSSNKSEPIYVYCYDPNTSTLSKSSHTYHRNTGGKCPEIIPHLNTLVSLKELGECLENDGSSPHN
ncbi:F-box protein At3g07870-like [Papaver somniferum]|uniref:F-box protein At3g07870-like n=1 Tax=Papaver somniferum TaxID=3469 RepID=UPI000E6FB78A|nr:F-box protein At3g07870-like [Papaver somniferum]